MILYFTGTGNSKFVADYLAEKLDDTVVSMNFYIKNGEYPTLESDSTYIVVAPVYAWRLPPVVEQFLSKTTFKGSKNICVVATMGENSGNADKYTAKLLTDKGMNFTGFIGVAMQNNYLLMEDMPDKTVADEQFKTVVPKLDMIAGKIVAGELLKKDDRTPLAGLMSGIVNWGFSNFMLKNQNFAADERCILCSRCVEFCPANNIRIHNGNIVFGQNCTGCFGCLHRCPVQAINVKGKTETRGRYLCPEYSEWKNR
ncbi:MAG: EFR1 family ferrodoxin [Oscillospiraceae bacterium]|nr:EFR1 family ferrodoxin [Oscillospiraceae bacterium]